MLTWILISIALMTATESDSKQLAQKGYTAFREVLSGDEAKLPEAIRYLEQAKTADENNVPNLYNLGRAYFFDGITFNKEESIHKAEATFARLLELDPQRTDAMAFHGANLSFSSRGENMQMFMKGAQELKTASQKTPDDITVRILQAVVSQQVPPQALPFIGLTDPVKNVQFIGDAFNTFSSEFAPYASVVMNVFIGETLAQQGDKDKARASFEAALKTPQPVDGGAIAARKVLDERATGLRARGAFARGRSFPAQIDRWIRNANRPELRQEFPDPLRMKQRDAESMMNPMKPPTPRIEVMSEEMAAVLRQMTGAERLEIASRMYSSARHMLMNHLRSLHPDWNDQRISTEAARKLSHGAI